MPGGDGTGPVGMGPMTGRAAGYCAGYPIPGHMNPVGGRGVWGWGRGRGGGRGWRNWFYATGLTGWQRAAVGWPAFGAAPFVGPGSTADPAQELEFLQQQAQNMDKALQTVRQRIDELQRKQPKE
jgi:hypothetical protein